jgi:hypothetical protein
MPVFQPITQDKITKCGGYLFYDRTHDVKTMLIETGLPVDAVDFVLENNPNSKNLGYHNNQHIFDVTLKTRDIAKSEGVHDHQHFCAVIMAALFHDIGYKTGDHPDSDNIREAVRLWEKYANTRFNDTFQALVADYIRVTEFPHQEVTNDSLDPVLVGVIRDADLLCSTHSPDRLSFLAGLGAESSKYTGCNPEFPPLEMLSTDSGRHAHQEYLTGDTKSMYRVTEFIG